MLTALRKAAVALVVTLSIASISIAAPGHGGGHMGGGHMGGGHMGGVHMAGGAHFHGGITHVGNAGFHTHFGFPHNHFAFGYAHFHYGPSWGFYGSYYPWFSLSIGGPAYYYAPAPVYYYSSPVVATYTAAPTTIVTQSSTAERIPAPTAELPFPAESKPFRYDGDRPAAPPVERIPPARDLEVPKLPEVPTPPLPGPRLGPSPSDMAVSVPATTVTKKYSYPAYGEDRLTKPSPREDKTALIRRDK
jgi:hypothetical protein